MEIESEYTPTIEGSTKVTTDYVPTIENSVKKKDDAKATPKPILTENSFSLSSDPKSATADKTTPTNTSSYQSPDKGLDDALMRTQGLIDDNEKKQDIVSEKIAKSKEIHEGINKTRFEMKLGMIDKAPWKQKQEQQTQELQKSIIDHQGEQAYKLGDDAQKLQGVKANLLKAKNIAEENRYNSESHLTEAAFGALSTAWNSYAPAFAKGVGDIIESLSETMGDPRYTNTGRPKTMQDYSDEIDKSFQIDFIRNEANETEDPKQKQKLLDVADNMYRSGHIGRYVGKGLREIGGAIEKDVSGYHPEKHEVVNTIAGLVGMVAQIGTGATVGNLTTKGVKALTATTFAVSNANGAYEEAEKTNMSAKDKANFVLANAGAGALMANMGLSKYIERAMGSGVVKEIMKQSLGEITANKITGQAIFDVVEKTIKEKTGDFVKAVATGAGEGAYFGAMTGLTDVGIKKATNELEGEDMFDLSNWKQDVVHSTEMTMIGAGVLSAAMAIGKKNTSAYDKIMQMKNDPEQMKSFMELADAQLKAGQIDELEHYNLINNVKSIIEADEKTPRSIADKNVRILAINLVAEKNRLQKQLDAKKEEYAKYEPELAVDIKTEIDGLEEQIKQVNSNLKGTMDFSVYLQNKYKPLMEKANLTAEGNQRASEVILKYEKLLMQIDEFKKSNEVSSAAGQEKLKAMKEQAQQHAEELKLLLAGKDAYEEGQGLGTGTEEGAGEEGDVIFTMSDDEDLPDGTKEELIKINEMDEEGVTTYIGELNKSDDDYEVKVNTAQARLDKLKGVKPVPKTTETPEQKAEKEFKARVEKINAIGDDLDKQENYEALETEKKTIQKISEKHKVKVPDYVAEAINKKESGAKKVSAQREIESISKGHEEEIGKTTMEIQSLHKEIAKIEKNKIEFTGAENDADFIKQQTEKDGDFADRMNVHSNLSSADQQDVSIGQEEAIKALEDVGILNGDEQAPYNMAEASSVINLGVKRIQWLKVNAKTNERAAELENLTKKVFKVLALHNTKAIIEQRQKGFAELSKDITSENAEHKKKNVQSAIVGLGEEMNRLESKISQRKAKKQGTKRLERELKDREKQLNDLSKLSSAIEVLHPTEKKVVVEKPKEGKKEEKKPKAKKKKSTQPKLFEDEPIVPNITKKEYQGKVGYGTPASGKSTLAKNNPHIIDGDHLLADAINAVYKKMGIKGKVAKEETIANDLKQFFEQVNPKRTPEGQKIIDDMYEAALIEAHKRVDGTEKTVLFGSHRMLSQAKLNKYIDFALMHENEADLEKKGIEDYDRKQILKSQRIREKQINEADKKLLPGRYIDNSLLLPEEQLKKWSEEAKEYDRRRKEIRARKFVNDPKKTKAQNSTNRSKFKIKNAKDELALLTEYKDNPFINPTKNGTSMSNAKLRLLFAQLLKKIKDFINKIKDGWDLKRARAELRKIIDNNAGIVDVKMAMEMEFELQNKWNKYKQEQEETVANANLTAEQKLAKAKQIEDNLKRDLAESTEKTLLAGADGIQKMNAVKAPLKQFYTNIEGFDNDSQIEKALNDIANNKTFVDGKPFDEDFQAGINELMKQGIKEKNDKKRNLALRLNDILNAPKILNTKGKVIRNQLSGEQKMVRLFMFFGGTEFQPYIAMNIAMRETVDRQTGDKTVDKTTKLIAANTGFENMLKGKVLNAMANLSEQEYQDKIKAFKALPNTIENQLNFLTDLTGIEKKYWERYIDAISFRGKATPPENRLPINVIGTMVTSWTPDTSTKDRFITNLMNKKGSAINTIRLNSPIEEVLGEIAPRFKNSAFDFMPSATMKSYLTIALAGINSEAYNTPYFKNNRLVQQFQGKPKGATVYQTSGANVSGSKVTAQNKNTNAEDMSGDDIMKMLYEMYKGRIHANEAQEGHYFQNLGQFGDKGQLSYILVKKNTDIKDLKKHFIEICKRNGLDSTAEGKLIVDGAKEIQSRFGISDTEAELFAFNYATNYAEANEIVNGELLQYQKGGDEKAKVQLIKENPNSAFVALLKRNASTASPGFAGNPHVKGGLGVSHKVLLVNQPKAFNDETGEWEVLADGAEWISDDHSVRSGISTGGMFHTIIKAITNFIDPKTGARVTIKTAATKMEAMADLYGHDVYQEMKRLMKEHGVSRITTIDGVKFTGGAKPYPLFKENSSELNPDAVMSKKEHIIEIPTENYLFQQDLTNDGRMKKGVTPKQRVKNMMGSTYGKEIQEMYNAIGSRVLDSFTEKINGLYNHEDKTKFVKFLLSNENVSDERIEQIIADADSTDLPTEDVGYVKTLLRKKVSVMHPTLDQWVQKFIANVITEEALGRVSNKGHYVEAAYIPSKNFVLTDYVLNKKTGKITMPTIAISVNSGLRGPVKVDSFKAAVKMIQKQANRFKDMFDEHGKIHEHEIYKENGQWYIPGEFTPITRVPADGNHSTSLCRVKYLLPKEMGNVIITPFKTQKRAGSDFDGDQRFAEAYFKEGITIVDKATNENKKNKKGKDKLFYHPAVTNEDEVAANDALHKDAQYFYDKDNFEEYTTGIDNKYLSREFLHKLPEEKRHAIYGMHAFIDARTRNTVGLRVVGVLIKMLGGYDYLRAHNSFIKPAKEVSWADDKRIEADRLRMLPIKKIEQGKVINDGQMVDFVKGWKIKKILGNLANSALDNVKTPEIERIGLNEITAGMFGAAIMAKPNIKGLTDDQWVEAVISYFTSPVVKKFVEKARQTKNIENVEAIMNLVGKLKNQKDHTFTSKEKAQLKPLQDLYWLSNDIDKINRVISLTESAPMGWAAYMGARNAMFAIEANELSAIDTKGFMEGNKPSVFLQNAKRSIRASYEFLHAHTWEETAFGQEIFDEASRRNIDDNGRERNLTKKQMEAFSNGVRQTAMVQSRKLGESFYKTKDEFVAKFLLAQTGYPRLLKQHEKELPTLIKEQLKWHNIANEVNAKKTPEQKKEAQKKLDEVDHKIDVVKQKIKSLNAKLTILNVLQRSTDWEGVKRDENIEQKGTPSLELREDLKRTEMEPAEKQVIHNAMDELANGTDKDKEFVKDLVNFAIIQKRLSASAQGGGFADLISIAEHKKIGDAMAEEKEKWNKTEEQGGYTEKEKNEIIERIFKNNPIIEDKNYVSAAGENRVVKDYDTKNFVNVPILITSDKKMDDIMGGERSSVNTHSENKANKLNIKNLKVGNIVTFINGDRTVQKEVTGVRINSNEQIATIDFKDVTGQEVQKPTEQLTKLTPAEHINYSGNAKVGSNSKGADNVWEQKGKTFGIGKQVNYRPESLDKLTATQRKECEDAYKAAAKSLKRVELDVKSPSGKLMVRDYLQAKATDAVFAVSDILNPGEKGKPSSKGIRYANATNKQVVDGGTGYAVEMAIKLGKPVYVFHQGTHLDEHKTEVGWYKWDGKEFEKIETPTLTKKYAGVGTRHINKAGEQAIQDVYEKTFGKQEEKKIDNKPLEIEYSEAVKQADSKPIIEQNFFDGYRPNSNLAQVHNMRPEIVKKYGKGVSTFKLIQEGIRTRTTRTKSWMDTNKPKVGDYFWQASKKNPNDKVLTRITAVYDNKDARFKGNWNKEGWDDSNFKYVQGYDSAIEFEVVKEEPIENDIKSIKQEIKPLTNESTDIEIKAHPDFIAYNESNWYNTTEENIEYYKKCKL